MNKESPAAPPRGNATEELDMNTDLDGNSLFLSQPTIIPCDRILYRPRLFDLLASAHCTVCEA